MKERFLPRLRHALAVLVLVAVLAPSGASASGAGRTASLDAGILEQLNRIRAAHGLTPLVASPALRAAALAHSREMLSNGYFSHDSSDGSAFSRRVEAFYPSALALGENLYWATNPLDATQSVQAWMASPEHRANILDPQWRQIGIAAVSTHAAPGAFDGLDVTVITTDFGVRRGRAPAGGTLTAAST